MGESGWEAWHMQILAISSNITGWLARGMIRQLDTHWPQHPPVIVGGYDKPPLQDGVQFHKIGEWSDYPVHKWSDGLIKFISDVAESQFLLTFDDFWLIDDVPPHMVEHLYEYLRANDHIARIDLTDDRRESGSAVDEGPMQCVYMAPGQDEVVQWIDLISTPPATPYQMSYQPGLWRKEYLLRYLVPGETPAESEIRGASRMSRDGIKVLGTRQAPFKIKIMQQHGSLHIDDPGYQAEGTRLLPEDRAELERLGYLAQP